jgi:hypothetical protein
VAKLVKQYWPLDPVWTDEVAPPDKETVTPVMAVSPASWTKLQLQSPKTVPQSEAVSGTKMSNSFNSH